MGGLLWNLYVMGCEGVCLCGGCMRAGLNAMSSELMCHFNINVLYFSTDVLNDNMTRLNLEVEVLKWTLYLLCLRW